MHVRVVFVLLLLGLAAAMPAALGAHKPVYKGSWDYLALGSWEAHFVWLRSDYFNYMGEVWWQSYVHGPGAVDIFFFDCVGFYAFRDGRPFQPLLPPMESVESGSQWISQLTGDLPYFLVLRNPGTSTVSVEWTIFAEIDWRRWQGAPPGPTLNLTVVQASQPLLRNDSWETTFAEPATFVYHCFPHFDMTAILEVVPSEGRSSRVDVEIHDMGFHPEVLRVPAGTTVNWTNLDGMEHSVQLGMLDGVFVLPPSPVPTLTWWHWVAPPAAVAILLLLLLRREW